MSILENIPTETQDESTQNQDEAPAVAETNEQWHIDENYVVKGKRPDWLPEKFKTVKQLTESYNNIESEFSKVQGLVGAPEKYEAKEVKLATDVEQMLTDVAKNCNLSNDLFNKLAKSYADNETKMLENYKKQLDDSKSSIGNTRITRINNVLQSLKLDESKDKALRQSINTLEAFEAFEAVIDKIDVIKAASQPAVDVSAQKINIDQKVKEIMSLPDYYSNTYKYEKQLNDLMTQKKKLLGME